MRFFEWLNLQHVWGFVLSALIFMLLFGTALAYHHFRGDKSKGKTKEEGDRFVDGIVKGRGPFPLIITIIIVATFLWALFYILMYGLSEVKL